MASLNQTQLRQLRQEIGMIFQHFNLLSSKTVQDNVALPLKVAGVSQADINKRVTQVLDMVGLSDKASMYPSQLSGGQKQRVGIARALVNEHKILLCDEATSALDPEGTTLILQLLKQINKKLGITIVLITHDMNIARLYARRVIVLHNGNLVFDDVPEELFNGTKDLTEWGLQQPTMAALAANFELTAVNADDFCAQLTLKAGDK